MQSLAMLLDELMTDGFFGSVEIKFENGQIVLIRKTETIKPAEQASRNNRGHQDDQKK